MGQVSVKTATQGDVLLTLDRLRRWPGTGPPEPLRIRPISLRAFDASGEMVGADLVEGRELAPLIERFLADPAVDYLHAHYAKRGCYAARIERV